MGLLSEEQYLFSYYITLSLQGILLNKMKILTRICLVYMLIWILVPKDTILFAASFSLHYQHHLERHGDISALNFFIEHLNGEESHGAAHGEEHHSFPCDHSHSSQCAANTHIKILTNHLRLVIYAADIELQAIPFQVGQPRSAASGIWQPPQLATRSSLRG